MKMVINQITYLPPKSDSVHTHSHIHTYMEESGVDGRVWCG